MRNLRIAAGLACAIGVSPQSRGQFIPTAGYVYASAVLADSDLVVVSVRASGGTAAELIGLDATTGAARWRRATTDFSYSAQSGNTNEFYEIDNGRLAARSRRDGQLLWTINLSALAWPAPDDDTDRNRSFFGMVGSMRLRHRSTPEQYRYSLILNRREFVVFRTGVSGGGCCISIDSRDWAAIDRISMKARTGLGELLASTRHAVLIAGGEKPLLQLSDGRTRDLSNQMGRRWEPETTMSRQHADCDRFCTFSFREPKEGASGQAFFDKLAVCDTERGSVRVIGPAPRHTFQQNWASTERYLVRFSECVGAWELLAGKELAQVPLWIEVYRPDGSVAGGLVLPVGNKPAGKISRYLSFSGIMADGRFVFVEKAYRFTPDTVRGKVAYANLVVVDPADLHNSCRIGLSNEGGEVSGKIGKMAETDAVVQIFGEVEVERMAAAETDCEVLVRAISLKSGGELWRHREAVKMRRIE